MTTLVPYLLVGIGGFLGANARFVLARLVGNLVKTDFPLGTFAVNLTGSFLLGVVGSVVTERIVPNGEALRLAIGVGFIGAYTTFSTFELETHALLTDGSWVFAAANVAGSVFLGLLALRAGIVAAKLWLP